MVKITDVTVPTLTQDEATRRASRAVTSARREADVERDKLLDEHARATFMARLKMRQIPGSALKAEELAADLSKTPTYSTASTRKARMTLPRPAPTEAPSKKPTDFTPQFYVGKLKERTKRARGTIEALHRALVKENPRGTQWALDLRAGDAVEVVYKDALSDTKPTTLSGVILGITKPRSFNAMMRVLCVVGTTQVEHIVPLHSPTIVDIRLLQKAFIHKGTKRVRRAKLYYLKDMPHNLYRVGPSKETLKEKEAEDAARKKARDESGAGKKKGAPGSKKKE